MEGVPEISLIMNGFNHYDYCDSYSKKVSGDESIDSLLERFFKMPLWVTGLLKLRDIIVKPFGLQTRDDIDRSLKNSDTIFPIIDRSENEIVMGKDDKHLNFRVSGMKQTQGNEVFLNITTIVKFNNIWGRVYFFPVKPFHKLIIKYMLHKM